MNVVLASVNYFDPADVAGACLRNWARRDRTLDGVAIDLVEFRDLDSAAAAARILETRPALVGFTCYLWNIGLILDIARRIKSSSPATAIVLGGAEVGPVPERVLRANPEVDFVASGEGEETFRLLVHAAVLGDAALADVPGLARRVNGTIVKTPPAPLIDLDLAPAVYDGASTSGVSAVFEGSRGCPFLCSFCDWGPRKMRYVPLERVERELRALAERYNHVIVCDADLLMDKRRGVAVMNLFRRVAKGKDCKLKFDTNPIFLCDEVIEILASDPELFCLSFGIQTTNLETLERIQRPFDLKKAEANLRRLKKAAPLAQIWFMTIAGLPGDDLDSFRMSIDWALQWRPLAFTASQLMMLPGAEISHQAHDPRLEYSKNPPYQVYQTDAMSRADMARARELTFFGEVLFQFRVMGRQAAVDLIFGGEFDAATMAPGTRIARLEDWIDYMKASGLDLTAGAPIADMDELIQRKHIYRALETLGQDKLAAAAFLHTTRLFAESRSRVAA